MCLSYSGHKKNRPAVQLLMQEEKRRQSDYLFIIIFVYAPNWTILFNLLFKKG